ncbi:hypothetical protein SAMN05660916_02364 [Arthrobacter sp. 31Cvi3.1E]|nr:hypothetical protein SAMN05660916_02364 [Arthrobacter sp. 31Cvi3.1E]
MTHQIPARKPLDSAIFFKTMRGLHPSEKQLEDLEVVEKQLEDLEVVEKQAQVRDRVGIKDSVQTTLKKGRKSIKRF